MLQDRSILTTADQYGPWNSAIFNDLARPVSQVLTFKVMPLYDAVYIS